MRNDFVSRLIDRAPTQEMKDRIAALAIHDFDDADLEAVLENNIKLIREREDKKLMERLKTFYQQAVAAKDKEKIDSCRRMMNEFLMSDAKLKESLRMK
jgi:hypothetical protein